MMGADIRLRPMTVEDTDNIVRWRNSESVRKNFIYQELFTSKSHLNWITTNVNTGKVVQMIIEETESKRPIGSVYIRDIDLIHHKGEYGIFIGEDDTRGKGYGTQAARLMIEYGFQILHLHKIFLRAFAENVQAIRSYEKAGFVQEAYLCDDVCINGQYKDMVLMAIIDKEEEKK